MATGILKICLIFLITCLPMLTACTTDSLNHNREIPVFQDVYNIDKIPWHELSGKIAFEIHSDTCIPTCFSILDITTRNYHQIPVRSTFLEEGVILYFLVWTHQPDQLTFLNRTESGEERIISVDVEGNTTLLYSSGMEPIEIGPPAWSHDGRVAYQVNTRIHTYLDINEENLNELWIDHKQFMSAYKDKDNPLNNRFFVRSTPSWSLDGKNLVVSVTNWRGYSALWNVNTADGSYSMILEKEVETDETGLFYNPSYSPDGKSIAFSAFMPGDDAHKVWIINSDGSGLRSPANREGWNPAWSPDGRYLIYGSTRYGLFEFGNPIKYTTGLYLVAAEGGEPILMTPNHMGAWLATWRP